MITREELHILMQSSTREAIDNNINRSPITIALDKRLDNTALVASQVKYLQRAKLKLPSYFDARCIIPSLAFEQSSSEATAATKNMRGESLLELTCGLGVDTLHLSKRFQRVVTCEQNEILAEVARENFRRLEADNITVVAASAEEYIKGCTEIFDWIYADPDRRGESGEKLVRLEECSPNILTMHPTLTTLTKEGLMVKCSPIFDVDEAFRLFEGACVEVVSSHEECKEVIITIPSTAGRERITATTTEGVTLTLLRDEIDNTPTTEEFDADQYKWLILPNVALQKSRTAIHTLRSEALMWSNNGFGFSKYKPSSTWGRVWEIIEIVDFQPKALNKRFAKRGVEVLKRDFPLSTSQLKLKAGGEELLALTSIKNRAIAIILKR